VSRDRKIEIDEMVAKEGDGDSFAFMSEGDILAYVMSKHARHVVITGGEPCLYDLEHLTRVLIEAGNSVQIETSGTSEIRADDRTFVTVSPKINMPGKREVLRSAILRANEIKLPVGKMADVERFDECMAALGITPHQRIWLQPLSQSDKATQLCVEVATHRNWALSLQTHKYLGVR
jgi:7-carboxy-7-deazaguanine synthase